MSAGREPTRLDLTVISGILVTGRMIDSRTGKPARDGWLRVTLPGSPNVSLNSAQANKEGEFELRLPPGEYEVRTYEWHDGTYRDRTWPLDLEEGTDRRELTLRYTERPGLDGRLVDRQGKPVKGKIMLGGGDPVDTSVEGAFSIPEPRTEGQPEGWAVGWATSENRKLARSLYWHRRERGKELEITLKPLSRVKGKLVNEAGEQEENMLLKVMKHIFDTFEDCKMCRIEKKEGAGQYKLITDDMINDYLMQELRSCLGSHVELSEIGQVKQGEAEL